MRGIGRLRPDHVTLPTRRDSIEITTRTQIALLNVTDTNVWYNYELQCRAGRSIDEDANKRNNDDQFCSTIGNNWHPRLEF